MTKAICYRKNYLSNQLDECVKLNIREICQEIPNPNILMFTVLCSC